MSKIVKIGGASGYWGESAMATPQLLRAGGIDYIIYDYLAEITMSILARAKAKDPRAGYAADFISAAIAPNLSEIARQGVKIIANAGGVNPTACAEALRAYITAQGLALSVAVVTGDDVKDAGVIDATAVDMFSGDPAPAANMIASANVYLGAFPIADALSRGADIVITGRCVDSALTLGPLIHEFGWAADDFDALASGSLAGHILECGPQATGGNFTDWDTVDDIANIGYPIAQINADGSFALTKPDGTGGVVNRATVSEQMLYEIGDPQSYHLPDVTCDFTGVTITETGENHVHVSPAHGRAPSDHYKLCVTYHDGFRAGQYLTFYGGDSAAKADHLADAIFTRARRDLDAGKLDDFSETSVELLGCGSQFGERRDTDEIVVKIAAKHSDARGVGIFLKSIAGIGLATPPGLSIFTGAGRPRPSPVVRLFSALVPKDCASVSVDVDGQAHSHVPTAFAPQLLPQKPAPPLPPTEPLGASLPLNALAWARSGDKGDSANIGVIAREPDYMPYIWHALTPARIADIFAHFQDDPGAITRFHLPSSHAMNILITRALGGGGAASLRNDAQAKGYSQILLRASIAVPQSLYERLMP